MIEEVGSIPSEKYSRGSEIHGHLLKIARRYDLSRNACLQNGVPGLRWEESDRKRVAKGKSVSVRCSIGGRRSIAKRTQVIHACTINTCCTLDVYRTTKYRHQH